MNGKKIGIIMLTVGVVAVMGLALPSAHAATYTVQKGDTLSGIAHRELGKASKWGDLVQWNNLEVEWKNGTAYVWIKPGQTLLLAPFARDWTQYEIEDYMWETERVMNQEIFRMAGIRRKYLPVQHDIDTINSYMSNTYRYLEDFEDIQLYLRAMERTKTYLGYQQRYMMVDEIYDAVLELNNFPFKQSKHLWIDHRMMSFLLLAILDVESNGKFEHGEHGEAGPYQIKPRTYVYTMWGRKPDDADLWNADSLLMRSHKAGLDCAIKILNHKNTMRSALEYYNRGSNKVAYAQLVLDAYNRIMAKTVTDSVL